MYQCVVCKTFLEKAEEHCGKQMIEICKGCRYPKQFCYCFYYGVSKFFLVIGIISLILAWITTGTGDRIFGLSFTTHFFNSIVFLILVTFFRRPKNII